MAAPKNNRRTGERWFTCARSGFEYPVSRRRFQNGLPIADDFVDEPGGRSEAQDPRVVSLTTGDHPHVERT